MAGADVVVTSLDDVVMEAPGQGTLRRRAA
jgi:hypothetical protein